VNNYITQINNEAKNNSKNYPICIHGIINRLLRNYQLRQKDNKNYLKSLIKIDRLIFHIESLNQQYIFKTNTEYNFMEICAFGFKKHEVDIFWLIKHLISEHHFQ